MKPKLIFLLLIFNFAFCIVATATVRYVSKTGTSTPPYTSWATASDSIQKCINICQSGDTVYVGNGVYKENLIINTEIALIGSSMDSTLIDGRGLGDYTIIFNTNGSIDNSNIYGKAKGVGSIIHSVIAGKKVEIKNCIMKETSIGVGLVGSSVIANNLIMDKLSQGFALVSANVVSYNISNCIILVDNTNSKGIGIGFASEATAIIKNNIILFNHPSNYAGYGISLGWPKKVYIYNNLISGFHKNIYIDLIQDTAFIKNNVLVYKNPSNLISQGSIDTENDNAIIINNIHANNTNTSVRGYPPFVQMNYNIFWNNVNDLYGLNYGDSDRVVDPMFIQDTIPTPLFNFDYHIQAYSPAIDKGDPNILDIDGTRSDIGMYGGPFGEITYYKDLAPKSPRNLSAVVDTNRIIIKWNRNTEADTAYYKVYRDTVQNFTVDSTKLIGTSTDTFYVHSSLPIGRYYYRVSCVDKQGNESKPSEEIAVNITTINDYPMTINDYFLYQNYPNPFNPSTIIGYKLKERGYVKLMVYDIKGELLSVLVNQEQERGYYEVEFTSKVSGQHSAADKLDNIVSGIYLYRIEVIGEGNIPVYTEMRKMLLVK